MNNIYLIGMMGSGKTSTGRSLAQILEYSFLDLDQHIEEKNRKSILEIFADEGEGRFRDEEAEALRDLEDQSRVVVSTGGGIVVGRDQNVDLMKKSGEIFYLRGSLDTLWDRVKNDDKRPLLQTENPKETLKTLLEKRIPVYEMACDVVFDTDGKTPEEVAQEIARSLK